MRRNKTCLHIKLLFKYVFLKRHCHGKKNIRLKRDFQLGEVQRESKLLRLVFGMNGMDREIPGHRKRNPVELKLSAETWAPWNLGILSSWPVTRHSSQDGFGQVTLPFLQWRWPAGFSVAVCCGILVLITSECSPTQCQGDSPPSQPKSSVRGICSMLAGSPLRETLGSHLLWSLQTGWCLLEINCVYVFMCIKETEQRTRWIAWCRMQPFSWLTEVCGTWTV